MKKRPSISRFLILLLLPALAAFCLAGCGINAQSMHGAVNADSRVYTNLPFGYEVTLPETWSIASAEEIAAFTKQTFSMFGGETETVTLQFANELMGAVYDKFGEDLQIQRVDEDSCSARVTVQVSPTFLGWVFQFQGKLRVTEPAALIEKYNALLAGACE